MPCRPSRSRRPFGLPALAGSVRPRRAVRDRGLRSSARDSAGDGLHQRLGGAAGLRDRDEARRRAAAAAPAARRSSAGSRLSRKCRRGGSRKRADARHGVAGELRQRLPAEARAAGAEEHHVGGALAQQPCVAEDRGDVVAPLRQAQQRQRCRRRGAARSAASASPVRCERGVERRPCAPCRSIAAISAMADVYVLGESPMLSAGIPRSAVHAAPLTSLLADSRTRCGQFAGLGRRSGPWAGRPP